MTDIRNEARVGAASGYVNTGSGDQIIIAVADTGWGRRPKSDPRSVALEQRLELSARFVPPPGFGQLQDGLAEPGRVALVTGPPGSGRRTAAVMALHRVAGRDREVSEIPFSDKPEDRPDLAKGDFWLLDLSSIAPDSRSEAWQLLGELWSRAQSLKVRLAAVLPAAIDDLDLSQFHPIMKDVGRPRAMAVLRSHLDAEGVPYDPLELRRFKHIDELAVMAMREIQRLARLTGKARGAGGGEGTLGWLHSAFTAMSERGGQVAKKVAELGSGRKRALLLATAMLEGARPEALSRQAEALLKRVGHTPDEKPDFERADLAERLKEVSAKVGDDGRICFEELSYGAAVRSHFWTYFPEFRGQFSAWAAEAVQSQSGYLGPQDRTGFLRRFTEQSLRTGEIDVLQRLAGKWAAEPTLGNEAQTILEQGVMHEQHGSAFRGWIYDQATKGDVGPATARVLVRVCSEVMASSHPEQALVRLHHLARRALEARRPLLELTLSDPRLYLKLLGRVCEGMERQEPRPEDAEIFLALVESPPTWVPRPEVVRGWRSVPVVATQEVWASGVRAWLSAARRERDGGERLMAMLIDASEGGVGLLSRYYLLALSWAAESDESPGLPSRADVAERFCQEIDRKQGIEPLVGMAEGSEL
ncbi:hypothetical protein ACFWIQ_37870 [Kitasatospora sp. NPDC127059]|uniref:hypothetical protein n=1 Tax=unclassified Kitasatospora TaxID=2633591 RepID=UPI003657235F